ncbi:GLPGLI family protein [Winogradskyella haliclonae]|uniref:GLPGLI family protein n=1 Tax=Winogradskyella haliclonae TaxID=2048558 RepID=A0ABQ2BVD1_9FLAO|nr:GLPGLI family protein [Winogradskyella haliclonae]GGI55801.1 GLPGLI family protein [Winogradskyella haliclonae]
MEIIVKLLLVVLLTSTTYAQEFKGVATYKTLTKLGIDIDSTAIGTSKKASANGISISSEMKEQIIAQLKKGSQQTYKLSFDKQQSIYKKEEKLAAPQPNSSGVNISFSFNGGEGDVLYKNTKEKRYTSSSETFGKLFLIQDELQEHDWKLENETKNIGEYTCYKATKTFTRTETVSTVTSFSINDKDEDDKEKKEPETKEVTVVVTAWYTPQIPVSTGPSIYHGLPGLILEVNDGRTTTVCSKIEINPKDGFEIKEPKKGKKVNQEEYDKIIRKKSEEQMEQFRSRRGRNGEGVQMIRIGG